MDDVARFYDDFSDYYHLIFEDWHETIAWQAEAIDRLIGERLGPGPKRILDATCGIGTQALGLAQLGHKVQGSDLSPVEIARARREAEGLGLTIPFRVADIRVLSGYYSGPFDVICTLDNALPHLEGEAELNAALVEIAGLLAPGGMFLASLRDYDSLMVERPRATLPRVFDDAAGQRVVFQVWDWRHDGKGYRFNIYIVRNQESGVVETHVFSGDYWCVERKQLNGAIAAAGLCEPVWLEPEESGFYQPIVMARTAAAN
jgi:SAM-dependent methyltransferase